MISLLPGFCPLCYASLNLEGSLVILMVPSALFSRKLDSPLWVTLKPPSTILAHLLGVRTQRPDFTFTRSARLVTR